MGTAYIAAKSRIRAALVRRAGVNLLNYTEPELDRQVADYCAQMGHLPPDVRIRQAWEALISSLRNQEARDAVEKEYGEQTEREAENAGKTDRVRRFLAKLLGKVTDLGQAAGWAILLPLKIPMQVGLRSVGISPPQKIQPLASLFAIEVIGKKYPGQYIAPEVIQELTETARAEGYYDSSLEERADQYYHLVPVIVAAIITGCVSIFSALVRAKKEGAELTPAEQALADAAIQAEQEYQRQVEAQTNQVIGAGFQQYLPIILIGVVLYVFIKE
jgi:hypothetical protein